MAYRTRVRCKNDDHSYSRQHQKIDKLSKREPSVKKFGMLSFISSFSFDKLRMTNRLNNKQIHLIDMQI